jgi:tetratricopeptide (TPR) repeat protein
MNDLVSVLCQLNKLKEAEELSREALNFNKANLQPNDPSIGESMNNLACVLKSLNRLK